MLTLEKAIDTANKLVEEYGEDYKYEKLDYVQGGCAYADSDGNPSCIVGQIFYLEDKEIFNYLRDKEDKYGFSYAIEEEYGYLIKHGIDEGIIRFLDKLQKAQDNGTAWSMAIRIAKSND